MLSRRGSAAPSPAPRRPPARLLFLAALLLIVLLPPAVVSAGSSMEALIRERQAELNELKAKLVASRERILQLQAEGKAIEDLLAELERQRSNAQRYLHTLELQARTLETDLAARQSELDRQEARLEAKRGELGRVLVHYYKLGSVQAAELIVSSGTFSEIFARTHYWGRTVKKLRESVLDVVEQRARVAAEVASIGQRKEQVARLRSERQQELARVAAQQQAQERAREQLRGEISRYEEQTRKLMESQAQIERLIRDSQRSADSFQGLGLKGHKGMLPWPVRGRVVTRFGTHVHPRYGTQVKQKGVEIAAEAEAPILAVAAGKVAFAGWLGGYGRTVILDHGQGDFTLYAHASSLEVALGEVVASGETVARVGDTDSLHGSCLHFEIRRGPDAVDPLLWLRR